MKALTFIRKEPLFFAALIVSLGIFAGTYFLDALRPAAPSKNYSDTVFLGGRIVSDVEEKITQYGQTHVQFVLNAQKIWRTDKKSEKASGKVAVTLKDPREKLAYGDEIVAEGELALPQSLRNPGGFDQKTYLETRNIQALFYGLKNGKLKVLSSHHGNFLLAQMLRLKHFLSGSLDREFAPREAAFLKALFLGERSHMDAGFKDLFIKTGTMHILAVSGFNIGFLSASLFFLLKPFPLSRDFRLWLVLVMIWLYCLLVGWQAPVVRASLMASIFIVGKLLGRGTNFLNSLGFAALVILTAQPKQLFDIGFQLSFLAVFGLVSFLPIFYSRPKLLPNEKLLFMEKVSIGAAELFWISFVSLTVTLPITVQNFYMVTPLSLVANMIVVPVSFLLFFAGILFFMTFWWVPKFLAVIPWVMKLLMSFFTGSLWVIENLPGAYFIVGKLHFFLLLILIAGTVYFLLTKRVQKNYLRAACLVIFFFNIFMTQEALRHFRSGLQMTVLDVGQGDSIYLEFPSGGNMLVDAGKGGDGDRGRFVVSPFLKSKGVRTIDALLVSHPQEDHIGGMPTVLDEFKVKNVMDSGVPYTTKLHELLDQKIQKEEAKVWIARSGMDIEGFKGTEINVLNPPPGTNFSKNINNNSIVLKIRYNKTSFLLTGDIQGPAMRELLDSGVDLHSDVLKVPHHGAKLDSNGKDFVKAVSPKISIISAGKRNRFGHPRPETLKCLNELPSHQLFRTDQEGAIEIVSDGVRIRAASAV